MQISCIANWIELFEEFMVYEIHHKTKQTPDTLTQTHTLLMIWRSDLREEKLVIIRNSYPRIGSRREVYVFDAKINEDICIWFAYEIWVNVVVW